MLRKITAIILICALTPQDGSASCEASLQLESDCGKYCFKVVKPLLEHATALRQQVASCEEKPLLSTDARLESIERLLKQQLEINEELKKQQRILLASRTARFEQIGSKTYYISRHRRLSWFDAEKKCRALGGHMVSLKNQEELIAISEKLKPNNFWVDIMDPKKSGDFISMTTGMKPSFLPWVPGEPNSWDNSENCVELKPYGSGYMMNDYNCNTDFHFVCEIPDF